MLVDLQNVNITLRILFRPISERLPHIFQNIGLDYDDRVLPSVVNEVLKAVVVRYFSFEKLESVILATLNLETKLSKPCSVFAEAASALGIILLLLTFISGGV